MPVNSEKPADSRRREYPQLRSKSELAHFVGQNIHFKGVVTVGLSERVCRPFPFPLHL